MPGAKKFALLGRACAYARNSSPRKPKMGEKRCFQARWASFFAEMPVEEPCWASFFAEMPVEEPCRASFFAPTGIAHGLVGTVRPPCLQWWWVCTTRSPPAVCHRRVGPSCSANPPAQA